MLVHGPILPRALAGGRLDRPTSSWLWKALTREWLVVLLISAWTGFLFGWRLQVPHQYIYDEVYHAYTGNLMTKNDPRVYEWWQSAPQEPIKGVQYEWTHPPLGKLIIGGSILLFGNNSLGWRFLNCVLGVSSVLLLYGLARALFLDRVLASLAALMLSVEGLAFAEARVGTNDVAQLAFLLAAYLCFAKFLHRPSTYALGWLFLTGIFLGFGLATKWPSLFSIGLLGGVALIRGIWPARWSILGRLSYLISAFVALIVVPFGEYMLSYLQMFLQPHEIPPDYAQIGPFVLGPFHSGTATLADSSWWSMFLGEQWQMWHYHTTLSADHPYYSKPWQWLLDLRPVFYYVQHEAGTVANTYNLGNPLLYWMFPVAIVAAVVFLICRRDLRLALVLAAFLIHWAPWFLSPRGLFFYTFLPAVPFAVLMVSYGLTRLYRCGSLAARRAAVGYVVLLFISFAFFYTQLAAWPVPDWYANLHYWMPSWQ